VARALAQELQVQEGSVRGAPQMAAHDTHNTLFVAFPSLVLSQPLTCYCHSFTRPCHSHHPPGDGHHHLYD
jgi:hypothetical protein